jgi:hypothetical protein
MGQPPLLTEGRARSWEGARTDGAAALPQSIHAELVTNDVANAPSRGEGRARPGLSARAKDRADNVGGRHVPTKAEEEA